VSHGIAQLRATLRAEFDVIGVRLCEIDKAIIPCVALFLVRLLPPLDNHGLLPNSKETYDLSLNAVTREMLMSLQE